MDRPNILLIMSDEHAGAAAGCYGSRQVLTPNIDALAARSLVFENAYSTNPICVPARMSFMTGRHTHDINIWDNDSPLSGGTPTFGSYLQAEGYDTVLCGRSHFVGTGRNFGFSNRLLDDLDHWKHYDMTSVRREVGLTRGGRFIDDAGQGSNVQIEYDLTATDLAVRYLRTRARHTNGNPWLLYVGYINPHFPLFAPEEYFRMYDPRSIALSPTWNQQLGDQHPAIRQLRRFGLYETPDEKIQRSALCAYYGLVSFVDDLVGRLVSAVQESKSLEDTVIIYMSDHGEMAGSHGLWQKCCFYEPSVRVPLIMHVPGAHPKRVRENVSLIDILPTLVDLSGGEAPRPADLDTDRTTAVENGHLGESLLAVAERNTFGERTVFSQYHANGSLDGYFMAKRGHLKYNYYVGHEPELYNVAADPEEVHDLAHDSEAREPAERMHSILTGWLNPEEVDRAAKRNQRIIGHKRGYVDKSRKIEGRGGLTPPAGQLPGRDKRDSRS